jgi:hypothetical protein
LKRSSISQASKLEKLQNRKIQLETVIDTILNYQYTFIGYWHIQENASLIKSSKSQTTQFDELRREQAHLKMDAEVPFHVLSTCTLIKLIIIVLCRRESSYWKINWLLKAKHYLRASNA